jgi:hypothetical protein
MKRGWLIATLLLLFVPRLPAQTISVVSGGQIDSLTPGYTYTLTSNIALQWFVVPQISGDENGTWAWFTVRTRSDSSVRIQFTLPTILLSADNTALPCSFNSTSIYNARTGGFLDPANQLIITPIDSLIDLVLGITVAVPSNALPGSYYGTIICRMVSPDTASATVQFEASVIHIVNGVPLPKALPSSFGLAQNYPNPFNPGTIIGYNLPKSSHVKLAVYNMLGQQIAILIDGYQEAGYKSVKFEMNNIPSGVYIYRLTAGTYTDVKKMILIR